MNNTRIPNRFVGMHGHSGCSVFDGLDYPQDHMDFVMENGMNAWSLTDHGHMNGYGYAYLYNEKLKKAGKNFKLITGCEMYVHPDLKQWKKDFENSKSKKEVNESILTPIIASTDENDETIDVGAEDSTLTIENEDETKSGKYNDPVKRRHHLVVLPKTSVGLQRLFHLVSRGYLEGFYRFPRIDYSMLAEAARGGHLLISTACLGGPMAYDIFEQCQKISFDNLNYQLLDDPSLMEKVINSMGNTYDKLSHAVGRENVCLELQFNKLPAQHLVNRALIEFAKRNSLTNNLVVTCDSHYSRPEYWKEREIYKKLGWLNHQNFDPKSLPQSVEDLKCELYPKNASQVWQSYLDTTRNMSFYDHDVVCDAIERTHDIAFNELQETHPDRSMKLPSYVIPKGVSEDRALVQACKEGLVWRGLDNDPKYIERLRYELKIIQEKKFSNYFLTMKAILDIARQNMLIGPGRGSAAGALVAYVLGITNLDPIEYDLPFERFMNPHRAGFPDIDSDVADRDKLIELLRNNFGNENVIPISNYNTFKLKSLIKDISKFYGIPFEEVNAAMAPIEDDVKKIIFKPGHDKNSFVLTYEDAIQYSKSLQDFIALHPEVADPIKVLFRQNRSLGRHAGGVIISENIAERMPLILARGEPQTPWAEGMAAKHLEELGWIKFDILGLETLRMVERTISLILQRHEGISNPTFAQVKDWFDKHMDPKNIDLNDQKVYEYVYHDGRFAGIFQLANAGAQRLFQKAKPRSILDIATLTSIYRPGPLAANVDKLYLEAKANPDKIDYQHPLIKKVLEPTAGCIIFQESVMRLCSVVAGFPETETDSIRRNIMKKTTAKDAKGMDEAKKAKGDFVIGAVKNGVPEKVADELYEKILFFAGYGFNMAHAVSYAIDSYYCAWLLTYYESEWLCAYLEAMSDSDDKRAKAFSEIKSLGYSIVPIDINHATNSWTILEGKKFMPSFLSCKGVGTSAVEEIVENRPFKSIESLLWNPDGSWKHSKFNKRALETLVSIKAFDSLDCVGPGKTFANYRQMYEILINHNNDIKKHTKKNPFAGRDNFYELLQTTANLEDWTRKEFVNNCMKYLSNFNPMLLMPNEILIKLNNRGIMSIDDIEESDVCWFIVTGAKKKTTKTNKPYLMLETTGPSGQIKRVFCWGWDGQKEFPEYSVCVSEITMDAYGCKTFMNKIKFLEID
jgi:DNA polymerase-3 subunit alpha